MAARSWSCRVSARLIQSGQNPTLFLVTIPPGVTTDPEVTAGQEITWDGTGAWTGLVVRRDPGQPIIWVAFGLLIAGLVLTFYFPRRQAWARIVPGGSGAPHIELVLQADRYVDRDRELRELAEAVAERTARVTERTVA